MTQLVDQATQGTNTSKFLKPTRDVGTITNFNRKFIVTQDWFFSKLYRQLIQKYFDRQDVPIPAKVLSRFNKYHRTETFREFDEPVKKKADEGTQTEAENP